MLAPPPESPSAAPAHIVVFSGHRVDLPDMTVRFPQSCVDAARAEIRARLRDLDPTLGIAAAASGGDIIFHEACRDLGIPTYVLLAIPPDKFVTESVAPSGGGWVNRFWSLINVKQSEHALAVLSDGETSQRKLDDSIWARANAWMIEEAVSRNPARLTVLALWNGEEGEGPGGTRNFIELAKAAGATSVIIDTRKIC
jgi:hypothetical protein